MELKTVATVLLLILSACLLFENRSLHIRLQVLQDRETARAYYRPNISRDQMNVLLFNLAGDSLAVIMPGDTSIYPYLIRPKPYFKTRVKDY